jgi:hypothetical protein
MEVLLHIGGEKFVMSIAEAMGVCETLNACSQLGKEWSSKRATNIVAFTRPNPEVAFITPITAYLRLEVESNMKELEEQRR